MSDDDSIDENKLVEVPTINNTDAYDHPSLKDVFRLSMWIPKEQVGKVIGKKGVVILHIQRETQAKVIMNPPTFADSNWSPVLITGDPSRALSAFTMIKALVEEVDDVVAEFPIPRQLHQRIVGSGGITIRTISAKTNVRIWVPGYKEVDAGSNISLEGECDNVFRALEIVLDVAFRAGANKLTQKKVTNSAFQVHDTVPPSPTKKFVAIPSSLVGLLLARRGTGDSSSPNVLRQLEGLIGVKIWKLNDDDPEVDRMKKVRPETLQDTEHEHEHASESEGPEESLGEEVEEEVLEGGEEEYQEEDNDSDGFEDARDHHEDSHHHSGGHPLEADRAEEVVTSADPRSGLREGQNHSQSDTELVYFSIIGDHPAAVYLAVSSLRRIVEGERIVKVLQRLEITTKKHKDAREAREGRGVEPSRLPSSRSPRPEKRLLPLGRRVDVTAALKAAKKATFVPNSSSGSAVPAPRAGPRRSSGFNKDRS